MTDDIEGTHGHLLAIEVLLSILVAKIKEIDPSFEDHARRVFDTHLGEHLERVGSPGSMEKVARQVFNAIISPGATGKPRG